MLRLIRAVKGPPATAARNRAILAVAYRSGLRIGEVLALCPKDVDAGGGGDNGNGAGGGALRVLNGKGGRARTAGIDAGALAIVAEWLAFRSRYPVGDGHPLFCTRSGRAVTASYVRRLLPHLAGLAGIHKRVHAHGLRHTHAAELRAEGVDIGIISKQLGHTSIATTTRYLDHIAPRAVVEAVGSSPAVAHAHYLQVRDHHFAAAAGLAPGSALQNALQQGAERPRTVSQPPLAEVA